MSDETMEPSALAAQFEKQRNEALAQLATARRLLEELLEFTEYVCDQVNEFDTVTDEDMEREHGILERVRAHLSATPRSAGTTDVIPKAIIGWGVQCHWKDCAFHTGWREDKDEAQRLIGEHIKDYHLEGGAFTPRSAAPGVPEPRGCPTPGACSCPGYESVAGPAARGGEPR